MFVADKVGQFAAGQSGYLCAPPSVGGRVFFAEQYLWRCDCSSDIASGVSLFAFASVGRTTSCARCPFPSKLPDIRAGAILRGPRGEAGISYYGGVCCFCDKVARPVRCAHGVRTPGICALKFRRECALSQFARTKKRAGRLKRPIDRARGVRNLRKVAPDFKASARFPAIAYRLAVGGVPAQSDRLDYTFGVSKFRGNMRYKVTRRCIPREPSREMRRE